MNRGDIWCVEIPFHTGAEMFKNRPAVIVSNPAQCATSPVVNVVYLTSQPKPGLPTHVRIETSGVPSTALCENIYTVDRTRLTRLVGQCSDEEIEAINHALVIGLGLGATAVPEDEAEWDGSDDTTAVYVEEDTLREKELEIATVTAQRDTYREMYEHLLARALEV